MPGYKTKNMDLQHSTSKQRKHMSVELGYQTAVAKTIIDTDLIKETHKSIFD